MTVLFVSFACLVVFDNFLSLLRVRVCFVLSCLLKAFGLGYVCLFKNFGLGFLSRFSRFV